MRNVVVKRKKKMCLKRRAPWTDLLLLIFGFVVGWVIVQWFLSPLTSCLCRPVRTEGPVSSAIRDYLATADGSVMIGIMTTPELLPTRAAAIFSTWGPEVAGLIVFYIGGGLSPQHRQGEAGTMPPGNPFAADPAWDEPVELIEGLPVVRLKGIGDHTYPPKDKCYAMIAHMYRNFGSRFDWFVRADDDVYIRYDGLLTFLNSVDPALPRYIGHPGTGMPEEKGRLGLAPGKPYCLGGPGVIFSRSALRQLVPGLEECARTVVTAHEDTELGRCVLQHVNIPCTSERQIKKLLHQDYSKSVFMGPFTLENVPPALTLHPVKGKPALLRMHALIQLRRLQDLQGQEELLKIQLKHLDERAPGGHPKSLFSAETDDFFQLAGPDGKMVFDRQRNVRDFLGSSGKEAPAGQPNFEEQDWARSHKETEGTLLPGSEIGAKNAAKEDENSKTAEVLIADNPIWDYAMLVGKTYMTVTAMIHPVRKAVMKEIVSRFNAFKPRHVSGNPRGYPVRAHYQAYSLAHGLQHLVTLSKGHGRQSFLLSSRFEPLQWRELSRQGSPNAPAFENSDSQTTNSLYQPPPSARDEAGYPWPSITILLTLSGRHRMYLSFLNHTSSAAGRYPARVDLRVALFEDDLGEHKLNLQASERQSSLPITVLKMQGPFSRGTGLNKLAEGLSDDTLLLILDVDLIITPAFLQRIALFSGPGKTYFPIFFNRYAPTIVCYGQPSCSNPTFNFSDNTGFWRSFSFGMAGLMAGDLRRLGGYDTDITGWGKEDIDFFANCISKELQIFRSPDPGLVHQFHSKYCDDLTDDQLRMCKDSLYSIIGSEVRLAQMVLDLQI